MRIASLLPSATEILCALGLQDQLVGVTHECDHPPAVAALPRVTRTLIPTDISSAAIDALVREQLRSQRALYTLDLPLLASLRPDLLVTQALCDVCAVAEAEVQAAACLLPGGPRVLNLEPTTLEEVFAAVLQVGQATGREAQALEVVDGYRARVAQVARRSAGLRADERPRVAFLEWLDPLFCGGHWSPSLIELAGGLDVLGSPGARSQEIAWERVLQAQPQVMVLACCGFTAARTLEDLPLLQARPGWAALPCVQAGRVYVTDGNAYFSRPGPRLVESLELLAHALHPTLHPPPREGLAQRVGVGQ